MVALPSPIGLIISIHAPRVGSDDCGERCHHDLAGFQSTLPVWGATRMLGRRDGLGVISIHAPRVGSDVGVVRLSDVAPRISIHAPRVGSDPSSPTPCPFPRISIHAPRVGSDRYIL